MFEKALVLAFSFQVGNSVFKFLDFLVFLRNHGVHDAKIFITEAKVLVGNGSHNFKN